MRKQFVSTTVDIFEKDPSTVLLLGDIGVHGFKRLIDGCPERAMNIGILEQATISVAAGLSMSGLLPFVHTIAPFLVERALEQIKVDFGYQKLRGNLISVGASYDYAALGCTHHCPSDIAILQTIPNVQILVPGSSEELDFQLRNNYNNDHLTYYRLSEAQNNISFTVQDNLATIVKRGSRGVIMVVGPFLSRVLSAAADMDVTIIYYNQITPFDGDTLFQLLDHSSKLVAVMPFYESTLTHSIHKAIKGKASLLGTIGVPLEFSENYGSVEEHDAKFGLDEHGIRLRLQSMFSLR